MTNRHHQTLNWFRDHQKARQERWRLELPLGLSRSLQSWSNGHAALRFLAVFILVWGCASRLTAQETPESRAFKSAVRSFQIGAYDIAQRDLTLFAASYPQSPMLPEALLFQARSALELTNRSIAIAILSTNVAKAGPLLEQYQYYLGQAYLDSGDFKKAAGTYAQIIRDFTNSTVLVEASYGEALARFKLGDFARASELLRNPEGGFQRATRGRPNNEFAVRGNLLLAESFFEEKKFTEAEAAARALADEALGPEYLWEQQNLICRILLADQRPGDALNQSTNLLRVAQATTSPVRIADSVALQGQIFEMLDQLDEAASAYTSNLADSVPPERRRTALLRLIEIRLAQDRIAEAKQMLGTFIEKNPEESASDVALLTLGEIDLRLHLSGQSGALTNVVSSGEDSTNRLRQAISQFDRLLAIHTNSPLQGKAALNKGWCLWLEGKVPESALAFLAATELLPLSADQAVARFKLGDTYLDQHDSTSALHQYRQVLDDYRSVPTVRSSLYGHVLYQMLHASMEANDLAGATTVMREILNDYPESPFGEQSLLLVGRKHGAARQPDSAIAVFREFLKRFPDSPLVPEVELASARARFLKSDWTGASADFGHWIERYPTNVLRSEAEYHHALATANSGQETNALQLFTDLVVRYPSWTNSPRAQYWIGNFYYNRSNYSEAQIEFQRILENTNWPVTRLTYEARMMAGRAAIAAQRWSDAIGSESGLPGHLTTLANDTNCPPELAVKAFFALGDALRMQDARPGRFGEALAAYAKIQQLYPTNRLVPLAWGSIGECYLQMAARDAKQYENATNAFWRVVTNALADVATRSMASYGIGRALELQAADATGSVAAALLKAAFEQYLNIVIGKNLVGDERPNPLWLEKAGLSAARLAEEQKQWRIAIGIYETLRESLEPLRPRLQERIEKAREQLRRSGN